MYLDELQGVDETGEACIRLSFIGQTRRVG